MKEFVRYFPFIVKLYLSKKILTGWSHFEKYDIEVKAVRSLCHKSQSINQS